MGVRRRNRRSRAAPRHELLSALLRACRTAERAPMFSQAWFSGLSDTPFGGASRSASPSWPPPHARLATFRIKATVHLVAALDTMRRSRPRQWNRWPGARPSALGRSSYFQRSVTESSKVLIKRAIEQRSGPGEETTTLTAPGPSWKPDARTPPPTSKATHLLSGS